jgi:hypothetical protein
MIVGGDTFVRRTTTETGQPGIEGASGPPGAQAYLSGTVPIGMSASQYVTRIWV